jgi:hypothetical protein
MRWYFGLFFISGLCSILCELIWLRLAMAQFAVTTALASIVLSAFMVGLGLGSWGAGHYMRTYGTRETFDAFVNVCAQCFLPRRKVITSLFHGELENEFTKASGSGAVEAAFLADITQAFPDLDIDELRVKIARGLVATVSFHSREVERSTGGDLGVVLVRPDVQQVRFGWPELAIDRDHKRGLLCQAKIFRREAYWGNLTATQKQTLTNKLGYLALLLYRYVDNDGDRRELAPFHWQLASDATVDQLSEWLSSNRFPSPQDSEQVLRALVRDEIGTDDNELIKRDITPQVRPSLVIRIGWSDGDDPGDNVHIQEHAVIHPQRLVQYH